MAGKTTTLKKKPDATIEINNSPLKNSVVEKYTEQTDKDDILTLKELIYLERGTTLVCKRYENASRRYDNTIEDGNAAHLFQKYIQLHTQILNKIEKMINKICDENKFLE